MALDPATMAAAMIARATAQGLVDRPPLFGLSRTYSLIARGIVETLLDPLSTIISITYTGQPAVGFGTGVAQGLSGLDPERFWPLIQIATAYFGPASVPFFFGLGGVIEYLAPAVGILDLLVPIGSSGAGVLPGAGILFNADACFDNMHSEAVTEQLMVVQLGIHVSTPTDTIMDPFTDDELELGDLFSRSEILLRAIAAQLTIELLIASKTPIITSGAFLPLAPPIVAGTLTAKLV